MTAIKAMPRGVRGDIGQALAAHDPQAPGNMQAAPGQPYETGDPTVDNFQRAGRLDQVPQDDPFADAYKDPQQAQRILKGAYYAGRTGDDGPIRDMLNGPMANTPMGKLIAREYQRGCAERGH